MSQRNAGPVIGGLVAGAAAAVIAVVLFLGNPFSRDTETDVMLSAADARAACELAKSTGVRVRQGKHLIWKVANYCTSSAQTVMVGDFRAKQAPAAANGCADAGPDYPFGSGERSVTLDPAEVRSDGSIKPTKGHIKLKANPLPGEEMTRTYEYSICLGGAPADPWVIVER